MPEISQVELTQFQRYQQLGHPDEVSKKIKDLEKDNGTQREEIRVIGEKVPKDGEVVVKKSVAEKLEKYEALGKPEEVAAKLTEGEKAKAGLKMASQKEAAAKFVKATGLDPDTVETLVAIPALGDAVFETKKGKVKDEKGQEVDGEIGYITLPGQGEKPLTFTEAQDRVPALKGLRAATPGAQQQGRPFIMQTPPAGGKPGETTLERIKREGEERNKPAANAEALKTAATSVEDRLHMTR